MQVAVSSGAVFGNCVIDFVIQIDPNAEGAIDTSKPVEPESDDYVRQKQANDAITFHCETMLGRTSKKVRPNSYSQDTRTGVIGVSPEAA